METREEFVDSLMARIRAEVERGIAELEKDGPATMDQIEEVVERAKTLIGGELTQRIVEREPEVAANQATCPACGGCGRFHSRAQRLLFTRHGEIRLCRRWYRCGCGHSFSPLDRQLGLDAGSTTLWLRTLVAEWAAERTFAGTARDLWRSRGLTLSESTVERIAVACGARLQEHLATVGAAYEAGDLPAVSHQPDTLYLSMDGVYAPLRDRWKKDGSAGKLECRGGECKIGMAYEIVTDRRGQPRVAWREYTATFADISQFRPLFGALASRCGVTAARRLVFLADTLACNWNLAADYFPDAVQIVDWRHAVSHLETVTEDFFGKETEPGRRWLAERKAELWDGKAAVVSTAILALPSLPQETEAQAETRRREGAYFHHHQHRMRYAWFRQEGYQIGSGVMEASCRTVVNQRLDQSGMHWRQETADKMVTLRAALLSTTKPAPHTYCMVLN